MTIQKKELFDFTVRAGFLPEFSDDAAFEAAYGTLVENLKYWNTTTKKTRVYNGTVWTNDGLLLSIRLDYVYYGGFPVGQADIGVYDSHGVVLEMVMRKGGSLVSAEIVTNDARTAGSAVASPTLNSSKLFDVSLDGTYPQSNYVEVAPGSYPVAIGDRVGVLLTSDANWTNNNGDLFISLTFLES